MKLLDLFCGAGGCSVGYARAGFDVTGVDVRPMPRYPFAFHQGDAIEYAAEHGREFDVIHASPPCQRYSMYTRNMGLSEKHPDLIGQTREALARVGRPSIIENVVGAPVRGDVMLCGSMFGLGVRRHRLFECSVSITPMTLSCCHERTAIPVFGHGTPQWHRKKWGRNISLDEKKQAMGIDWMSRDELSEAIPPAYTEWLGHRIWFALTLNEPSALRLSATGGTT